MGFFSTLKSSSIYNKHLKMYGINSNSIPADVNGRICSYTVQQHERLNEKYGAEPLDASIGNTARLVAYCIFGEIDFKSVGGDVMAAKEMVNHAARMWKESGGQEASLESMIISTLSDADILDREIVKEMNKKIS